MAGLFALPDDVALALRRGGPRADLGNGGAEGGPSPAQPADLIKLLARHGLNDPTPLPAPFGPLADRIQVFRARHGSETCNVKVYRLPETGRSPETGRLLMAMWDQERRILEDLSTRRTGRGLTAFRWAEVDRDARRMLVVTEATGPETLRELIDQHKLPGRDAAHGGPHLWSLLHGLIEAVDTLHRAGYLHRAIRPENVHLSGDRWKLANFEWSVYTQALTGRAPRRARLDRYVAPEVLRRWSRVPVAKAPPGEPEDALGESFASDVYSLGLLLFEVLVGRVDQDLGSYVGDDSYDEAEHHKWLESLRDRAVRELKDEDERQLLLEMLAPRPSQRGDDLGKAAELAWYLAQRRSWIQQQLDGREPELFTTLRLGQASSIDMFLREHVRLDGVVKDDDDLRRFVQNELAGARVYRNAGPSQPSLFLEGRRASFTVVPFSYEILREGGPNPDDPGRRPGGTLVKRFPEAPYLVVARPEDARMGPPLARLPRKVRVRSIDEAKRDLDRDLSGVLDRGLVWKRLFEAGSRGDDALAPAEREAHSLLAATAQAEQELWESNVLPYRRVAFGRDDLGEWVDVEGPPDDEASGARQTLVSLVAQHVARGLNEFDLSARGTATSPFPPNGLWRSGESVGEGRVRLRRPASPGRPDPPESGVLRPRTLEGNRALLARRYDLLRRLWDDPYLLRAVADPEALSRYSEAGEVHYFNASLDTGKRRAVREVLSTRPLYVVQGPPGTGKTTLAAEVIQQVLSRARDVGASARVLVTSQAHSPLNNLLARVTRRLHEDRDGQALDDAPPVVLRLYSSNKRAVDEVKVKADPAVIGHLPETVAHARFEIAAAWRAGPHSEIPAAVVHAWGALLRDQREAVLTELQRRLLRTADIIFVTANDRQLYDLGDDQMFDLMIYEEAAKAYPLEILAPMQHARHWLLIGDQDQLPPFNADLFQRQLGDVLKRLIDAPDPRGKRSATHARLTAGSLRKADELVQFFPYLFRKGESAHGHRFAARLQNQWRMHPEIGTMLRTVYYHFLKNGEEPLHGVPPRHPVVKPAEVAERSLVWLDVPLAESADSSFAERVFLGGGYRNPFEAQAIHDFLARINTKGRGFRSVLMLSPYMAQVNLLRQTFNSWVAKSRPETGDLRDTAATVDSTQGREAQVVIVSLVRNNTAAGGVPAFGFLTSKNRTGVMFSRAEALLVIVGSSAHFLKEPDSDVSQVYRYIKERGGVVELGRRVLKSMGLADPRNTRGKGRPGGSRHA